MRIVTLTLNPCVDETVCVEEFGGETVLRDMQSGGKGVNVARVLCALGVACTAVAPAGGAEGALFCSLARSEGVRLVDVPIAESTRRVVTQRRLRDDAQRVTVSSSPRMTPAEIDALRRATISALEGAACLAVCGSACCEEAAALGEEMLRYAKSAGVRTLLDGNGTSLRLGARALPDLIKPNRRELIELVGHAVEKDEEERAASEILARGAGAVLVTMGADGAAYFARDFVTYCPAPRVIAVNEVGSGDSFTAGFLYGQIAGMNLFSSMAFACACGAANAAVFPAARIGMRDVERFMSLA